MEDTSRRVASGVRRLSLPLPPLGADAFRSPAPFNPYYYIINTTTSDVEYYSDNDFDTTVNSYRGGVYQQ